MRHSVLKKHRLYLTGNRPFREQARVQTALLLVLALLACVAIGTAWLYRAAGRRNLNASDDRAIQSLTGLSDGTKAVLRRIGSPIEIRFYAVPEKADAPVSWQRLVARVDQLLSAYEQEAAGRIKVIRHNGHPDLKAAAAAAVADGIKPSNLEQNEIGYFGLVLVQNGKKESLPQLSPEWEEALESDLSRALARLIDASASPGTVAGAGQIDPAVVAEVKRQIPNVASVSLEEGTRILRESALNDFKAMATEMEAKIREAEQRVQEAQQATSESAQQESLKQLQQLRADQAAKLKEITARSAAQIEALRQLKQSAR